MKHFVEATLFDSSFSRMNRGNDLTPQLYSELCRRWPQFSPPPGSYGFCLKEEVGSQVLCEILHFLAENGRIALWGSETHAASTGFSLHGSNLVEAQDFAAARYLRMIPAKDIASEGGYKDNQWHLWADARTIYYKVNMGSISAGGQCVVDTVMRDLMIKESFRDLEFRPVEIYGESPRAKQLWQVFTERVLPAHLPIMQNADGAPFDPDSGVPRANHVFYKPYALQWRRSEIDAMGDFDFARTCEYGMMFVSKRVYEWFDKQRVLKTFFPLIEK